MGSPFDILECILIPVFVLNMKWSHVKKKTSIFLENEHQQVLMRLPQQYTREIDINDIKSMIP